MTEQDSARALLKIAYRHLDLKTAVLDLEKFWEEATSQEDIFFYEFVLSRRNNADQLLNALQKKAGVESLADLFAKIPEYGQEEYNSYLAKLASEGLLPIAVERERQSMTLRDKRAAVTALYFSSRR